MPPDHPARDMQDTFYLEGEGGCLLRTHTSSAQIHYMLENAHPPDVRIICPGKVFRRDSDVTHSPMFQQIEGLVVGHGHPPRPPQGHDRGVPARALRRAVSRCASAPRTSPTPSRPSRPTSAASSAAAPGSCRPAPAGSARHTGWLEILGSGMVNPAVFEAVNARLGRVVYDPEEVTGFAFGLGIERVAMVRHGIDDIRLFYENDLRFLEQFASDEGPALLAPRVRPLRGRAAAARRGPHRGRPGGGRDRDRGRGDRPRARHHHEPRRLHERPRRGPRGGGPLRPGPAAARDLGGRGGPAGRPRRSTSRSRPPTCAAASARACST